MDIVADELFESITAVMRLIELTDSTLPVGTFSFSNGLETAAEHRLVVDVPTLEAYVRDMVRQAATADAVVALHAFRNCRMRYMEGVVRADKRALSCKLNDEMRLMTCRMGRKLAELMEHIRPDPLMARWAEAIDCGETPGSYPVAQGLAFCVCGLSERSLFAAHQYGVIGMILGAALRTVRVSHYDTQQILFRLGAEQEPLYEAAREMTLDDIYTFTPQADILASLHEKGTLRMFMN